MSSQGKPFTYSILIREHHLDTFGHVNNAKYLELLEEARWQWITEGGYDLHEILKTGLGPVILEIHLKFHKEIRLRQEIQIITQALSYEGKIGKLKQIIQSPDGASVFCEATMVAGLFNTRERRLVEPTAQWLKALGI